MFLTRVCFNIFLYMLLSHKELSFFNKDCMSVCSVCFTFLYQPSYLHEGKSASDARRKFNSQKALLKDYTTGKHSVFRILSTFSNLFASMKSGFALITRMARNIEMSVNHDP